MSDPSTDDNNDAIDYSHQPGPPSPPPIEERQVQISPPQRKASVLLQLVFFTITSTLFLMLFFSIAAYLVIISKLQPLYGKLDSFFSGIGI